MTEEQITREEAKQLIDEYQAGTLIVTKLQPKPAIGDVDPAEREFEGEIETYQFGGLES